MSGDTSGLPETAAPSPEYVAQMTGATHSDPTPAPAAGTPPADAPVVPDKFKNADGTVNTDALLRSYSELEKKQSAAKAPEADPQAAAKQPDPAAEAKPGAKVERPADEPAAGTPPSPLSDAVTAVRTAYESGEELTEDLIKPLTEAGLPREMIDTYFAGLKAIESSIELSAHEAAGGKDNFEAARSWAATALSDQELDYYNTQAANPQTAKQAVEWLMAKHTAANPSEGRMVEADPMNGAGAGDTFSSQHEVTEAMKSPQYKTSPAYRQQVAEKLQRSIRSGSIRATAEYHSR